MTKQTHSQKADLSELKIAVDLAKELFEEVREDAAMSSALLDLNIQDSFSKMISDTISNPLKTSFHALKSVEAVVLEQLNALVVSFLSSHRDIIKKAFRFKSGGNLIHYTIVLSNDDLTTKEPIHDFLTKYERSALASRFPIVIQDIPNELENALEKELTYGKLEPVF